jgi:hypothetical protein
VPGVGGNLLEAMGPIVSAPGVDLDLGIGEVDLDAVAVLISWIQRSPFGAFSIELASAGAIKPGKGALAPIAAGFLRWKAMAQNMRIGSGSWISW